MSSLGETVSSGNHPSRGFRALFRISKICRDFGKWARIRRKILARRRALWTFWRFRVSSKARTDLPGAAFGTAPAEALK